MCLRTKLPESKYQNHLAYAKTLRDASKIIRALLFRVDYLSEKGLERKTRGVAEALKNDKLVTNFINKGATTKRIMVLIQYNGDVKWELNDYGTALQTYHIDVKTHEKIVVK